MKSIFTYYKERLVEISGKNRSLYMRSFSKKTAYDLGRIFEADAKLAAEFVDFLWKGKKESFPLLCKENRELLMRVFAIDEKAYTPDALPSDKEERVKALAKVKRSVTDAFNRALEKEVQSITALKREIEDIEKETGRYELFVGYPYVYGGTKDNLIKAPLLLFPVEIEIEGETTVNLSIKKGEAVELNKAFILAYAQAKKLDIVDMDFDFESLSQQGLGDLDKVIAYLKKYGVNVSYSPLRGVTNFRKYREPDFRDHPTVHNTCMLGRFSLANSIYNDYSELEKNKIMNGSAAALLNLKSLRFPHAARPAASDCYYISDLDYAQRSVVEMVSRSGNAVIYGPPGTGKSQTIVNLISDAVCKGKKVLVVSQKKAALDVVFNRLGALNVKSMFIVDPARQRRDFYETAAARHTDVMASFKDASFDNYNEIKSRLEAEVGKLKELSDAFGMKSPFGLSLLDMYYNSFIPGKKSGEYSLYVSLLEDKKLMALDYPRLRSAVDTLLEADKLALYYNYIEIKKSNPFFEHVKHGLPIDVLSQAKNRLEKLSASRAVIFDENDLPYARSILAHYKSLGAEHNEKLMIKMLAAFNHPKSYDFLRKSRVLFPLYPVAKYRMLKKESEVRGEYQKSKASLGEFLRDYDFLRDILTSEGFAMATDGLLSGNSEVLGNLQGALSDYVKVTDVKLTLGRFSDDERTVLKFAYRNTGSFDDFKKAVSKLLPIRIYHEVISFEDKLKLSLSKTADYENIKARITALLKEQQDECKNIFLHSFDAEYRKLYSHAEDNKDYLYQITKKQSYWPVRKTMEQYGKYLRLLFPCWLMSPENVSSILPLEKDSFDLVLFDEASQVLIESTIPSIIRGKNIVVAGDAKQLRPTTTFMRRYMGGADDEELDLSVQAALEVESLLDLAVARYDSANITYHYRSTSRELIDFSNKAFYSGKLRIAPNVARARSDKPITRILVDGRWHDRKNEIEAKAVIDLLKKLFRTRKNNETIGIITFNVEQQAYIEDLIDLESKADAAFRSKIIKETSRKDNGQDVSLFVKNIENVQGDERDIIIFSISYAVGDNGRVNANFGPLSAAGGENRLNVAVTRAKRRIYVVTSIEPEELKVDASKHIGPKLFRQYLTYVRAVSSGKTDEIKAILDAVGGAETEPPKSLITPVENQIASKLRKLGYTVDTNLGSGKNKLSLAVYDKEEERYILGVQLDQTVFKQSDSVLERDIFGATFLEQKGWKLMHVWSRDWWHNSDGVIREIVARL